MAAVCFVFFDFHRFLVCCLCHMCKWHVKGKLDLRTNHRTPIELKKAPVDSWAKFLPTHYHLRSLPPMKRFAFPHWIQHLKLRALEISHLLTFCKNNNALPAILFCHSLHVSKLCAPGVAAHAFLSLCSVISFWGGCVSWLANSPLGFQHEAVFLEFDVSCFSCCPFLECRQRPSNLTLRKDIAMWPNG